MLVFTRNIVNILMCQQCGECVVLYSVLVERNIRNSVFGIWWFCPNLQRKSGGSRKARCLGILCMCFFFYL